MVWPATTFALPVKDLAAEGFQVAGGRCTYWPGNTAATLVYMRRQHVIYLFIWLPGGDDRGSGSGTSVRDGYNYVRWNAGMLAIWRSGRSPT